MTANQMENPLKSQKSKTYQKARGMVAPFAFLFSIVVYIYIFYIFSFSPSTLITDNKFWFFISNTLILIIAADYGAFSSSKDQKRDLYDEYSLHSRATSSSSTTTNTGASLVSQYPENIVKKSIPVEEDDDVTETNNEIPEKILEVVEIEPYTDNFRTKTTTQQELLMNAVADNETYCDHHQVINNKNKMSNEPKTIRRSKSERVKHVKTLNDDKKSIFHRSNTEKQHEVHDELTAKDDEFSTMSNEELNRRVEEFIQKFNRQIRLQASAIRVH